MLSITRNKKSKHNKILLLAKSKSNRIEAPISQALIDLEISHEEFITISKEKGKYEKMKQDIRAMKSSDELNKIKDMLKIKKILFLFRLISAERYKNAQAYFLRIRNTDEIWLWKIYMMVQVLKTCLV